MMTMLAKTVQRSDSHVQDTIFAGDVTGTVDGLRILKFLTANKMKTRLYIFENVC